MDDIEYKLRFLLNSMTLLVDDIKVADSSQMGHLQFLKKYKNQKMIHAFIKPQGSSQGAHEPTITPLIGVPIDPEQIKHKMMYCQIAVGSSLFTSEEYALNCKTPHGYDSFIIGNASEAIESVIGLYKKSKNLASYSYVVPDSSRVLVLAEVDFTYDRKLEEKSKNNDKCEYCCESMATSFCLAERAAFCDKCDSYFHSNEFTQRHSRYYFNKVGKKRFLHCRSHPTVVVDYFCTECSVPVCTQCRIGGSAPDVNMHQGHRMVSYIDACDNLSERISESHEMDLAKRQANGAISGVEKEIEEFEKEVETVRAKLQYEYDTSMGVLNDLVKRRYQKINAKYFEGKYLLEMATRAQNYPREVDPSVLVEKWRAIEEMNRSIADVVLEDSVGGPQLIVKGSLTVELAAGPESSPANVDTSQEDDFIRRRTEMLLRVSQFK
ncbi:uncharacterized protein NEMAJ01_1441 [Nematocida major]|uniref:uncharacterized protein n=1 Tax=Nematocida major TaxID=1912982 RepID=UPI0020082A1B|nr:uncharacterized protein NEMAJ01_1441 [Nematocida major]KAH9386545.1 hypothetical protein NEMAJ01_1441 [Nematocida major]